LKGEKLHTWTKKYRTEDLALSPDGRWLVAMDNEVHIYVYDYATRQLEYEMGLESRPTSVSITRDSKYLLVNKQEGGAQLFNIVNRTAVQKYIGATGGDYLIRSDFGGANESFVISGSEGEFWISRVNSRYRWGLMEDHSQMVACPFGTSLAGTPWKSWRRTDHGVMLWPGAQLTHVFGHPVAMTAG
jgi:hypothetical protein